MKNLFAIKALALVALILCNLTTTNAQKKEWKFYSFGQYYLNFEIRDGYGVTDWGLFEERDSVIIMGVEPYEIKSGVSEIIVGGKESIGPIAMWSKKTLDFIPVKTNWQGKVPNNTLWIRGLTKQTLFLTENVDTTNFNLYYVQIFGDSVSYTRINHVKTNEKFRFVTETGNYIIVIADDPKGNSTTYVYNKNLEYLKSFNTFGYDYKVMSVNTLTCDGQDIFIGSRNVLSSTGAVFKLDIENDTSYLTDHTYFKNSFDDVWVKNIDGYIYARGGSGNDHRLYKWNNQKDSWVATPTYGSVFERQDGIWEQRFNHFNQYYKVFNPKTGVLGTDTFQDYFLSQACWDYVTISDEASASYYQTYGEVWNPYRIVTVGKDTFAFGHNAIAKLHDRNVSVSDVHLNPVLLYPNPANEFVTVSTPIDATFTVTDITGKIVLTSTTNQIADVSFLNKGIYFVTVTGYSPTKLVLK